MNFRSAEPCVEKRPEQTFQPPPSFPATHTNRVPSHVMIAFDDLLCGRISFEIVLSHFFTHASHAPPPSLSRIDCVTLPSLAPSPCPTTPPTQPCCFHAVAIRALWPTNVAHCASSFIGCTSKWVPPSIPFPLTFSERSFNSVFPFCLRVHACG